MEVMIAVAMLAVGLIGILGAYMKLVDALGRGQDYIDAFSSLKGKMADIERDAIEHSGTSLGATRGSFEDCCAGFNWELKVSPSLTNNLNEVTLAVARQGRPRTYVLMTYLENKK